MPQIDYDPITGENIYRQSALQRILGGVGDAIENRKREKRVSDVINTPPEMTTTDWQDAQRQRRKNALSYRMPGYSESNPYATGNRLEDISSNVILPLIAAAEVIGTKGRSGGEAAMAAMKNIEVGKALRGQSAADFEKTQQEERKRLKQQELYDKYGETLPEEDLELFAANPEKYIEGVLRDKFGATKGASTYEIRRDDLQRIRNMPEGPEKEQAYKDFLTTIAAGTVYGTSDEAIEAALKKAYSSARGKTLGEASVSDLMAELEAKRVKAKAGAELEAKKEEEKATEVKKAPQKAEVLDIIQNIRNSTGLSTGLDPDRIYQYVPGTEEYTFAKQVENLKNKLSLEGREKLKGQGQISDFEGKMLANSMSILDVNLKEDAFLNELKRIEDILNGKYRIQVEDKINLAKQALNDPEATPEEKAKAQEILRNAGVQ